MSYQVGPACYADLANAGGATCSNFPVTVTTLQSGQQQTLSCLSADVNGALTIRAETTQPVGPNTVKDSIFTPVYQPCIYQDWVDAGLLIAAACLGVWVIIWGHQRIIEALNWGRGND